MELTDKRVLMHVENESGELKLTGDVTVGNDGKMEMSGSVAMTSDAAVNGSFYYLEDGESVSRSYNGNGVIEEAAQKLVSDTAEAVKAELAKTVTE